MGRFVPVHHEAHDDCFAEEASQVLAGNGLRVTRPRRAVVELLERSPRPMGAADIHQELRTQGIRIDRASVYRVLAVLEAQGLVHRVLSAQGYMACHPPTHLHLHGGTEPADHSCHHHLVCRACGRTLETHCDGLRGLIDTIVERTGFQVEGHVLEIVGTCRECRQK
ncbi:MAG: transcriptional repressor [Deltaproteobacteria bacterium]|nr:transcriptional repressor [Deltaproteobacteria bacterium]